MNTPQIALVFVLVTESCKWLFRGVKENKPLSGNIGNHLSSVLKLIAANKAFHEVGK